MEDEVNREDFESLRTNGVKVNYYAICQRKLWFYSHHIRMEKSNEKVDLARSLHETSYENLPRREILIDDLIRIDLLKGQTKILEVKYSQRMKEASKLQILYYLYYLKKMGVDGLTGEIRFPKERKIESVKLSKEDEREIEEVLRDIRRIEKLETPPEISFMPICRSCAYIELCWG